MRPGVTGGDWDDLSLDLRRHRRQFGQPHQVITGEGQLYAQPVAGNPAVA